MPFLRGYHKYNLDAPAGSADPTVYGHPDGRRHVGTAPFPGASDVPCVILSVRRCALPLMEFSSA